MRVRAVGQVDAGWGQGLSPTSGWRWEDWNLPAHVVQMWREGPPTHPMEPAPQGKREKTGEMAERVAAWPPPLPQSSPAPFCLHADCTSLGLGMLRPAQFWAGRCRHPPGKGSQPAVRPCPVPRLPPDPQAVYSASVHAHPRIRDTELELGQDLRSRPAPPGPPTVHTGSSPGSSPPPHPEPLPPWRVASRARAPPSGARGLVSLCKAMQAPRQAACLGLGPVGSGVGQPLTLHDPLGHCPNPRCRGGGRCRGQGARELPWAPHP